MIKLSAVIITYNEEKNIKKCLESLQDIADEIIIIDSFSTDKTEKIVRKFDVKFIKNKFEGHIEQKNFAMQSASNNYILSVDADEILSKKLKNEILKVKNNWQFDAYLFSRLNYFCDKKIKHAGWYPDKKTRLWDRRKGKWDGENPHDKIYMSDESTTQYLKGNLLHYSFTSIEQHVNQINKFSSIKADVAFAQNKKTSILKIIFLPVIKFFTLYFLKLGFLDGFYGFVISINSAHSNFLKYSKLYSLRKNSVSSEKTG